LANAYREPEYTQVEIMTESEWNACTQLEPMLAFVTGRASERKLRLFSCACCRRAWHLMTDSRHRRVVEAAERFADNPQQEEEFADAMQAVTALWALIPDRHEGDVIARYMTSATRHLEGATAAPWAASFAARGLACLAGAEGDPRWNAARRAEEEMQCRLLRDIIGDPSRPFQFDAAWLVGPGAAAVAQARAIYGEGRFADVPSLAETLERAGCHDSAVLDHCREPNIHVRGCWVVDALLGRESAVRFGLMTEADWHTCGDPKPLLHILRDKGNNRKCRLFAVACCRRIECLIVDEPSRRAVEMAMRYADGEATEAEVHAARADAYQAVEEAWRADYDAEAEANFCITPEYAAASCRLSAACAAWAAICPDTRVSAAEPESFEASRWRPSDDSAAFACGHNVHVSMGMVQSSADANAAEAAERTAHCDLLRDLFGDYFGPPGEEGSWLAFGSDLLFPKNRPEQWCLLPTRRNTVLRREWLQWNEGLVPKLAQAIYDENAFHRLPILADALEEAGCTNADILNHCRQSGEHVRGCWVIDTLLGKS
jgi:hypothetical protein